MNIDTHSAKARYGTADLDLVGGSPSLDRSRVPFADASITVRGGYEIDGRVNERVRLSMREDFAAGQTLDEIHADLAGADLDTIYATVWSGMTVNAVHALYSTTFDGEPFRMRTHIAMNLGVRRSSYDSQRSETTITLASDELFAQDYKSIVTYEVGFGTDLRTTVEQALRYIGATLVPGGLTYTLEEAPSWEPGQSLWSFLSPLVTAAGLLLYSDHNRTWWLVAPDTPVSGTVTLSGASTVVGAVSTIDRSSDEWGDAVLVMYSRVDSNGATIVRYDAASVPRPTKTLFVTFERTRFPGSGAAQAILNRALRRGRQIPVSAVNDYTARPGMKAAVAVSALTILQQGKVKAVSWSLHDGDWLMDIDAYDFEAVESESISSFPSYVMVDDLVGMISDLDPGAY